MSVARIELNTNYTKSGDREVADCFGVQDKGRYLNIFFKSHQMRRFLYQMKEEKMRITIMPFCIYWCNISEVVAFQTLIFGCTRYDARGKKKL